VEVQNVFALMSYHLITIFYITQGKILHFPTESTIRYSNHNVSVIICKPDKEFYSVILKV